MPHGSPQEASGKPPAHPFPPQLKTLAPGFRTPFLSPPADGFPALSWQVAGLGITDWGSSSGAHALAREPSGQMAPNIGQPAKGQVHDCLAPVGRTGRPILVQVPAEGTLCSCLGDSPGTVRKEHTGWKGGGRRGAGAWDGGFEGKSWAQGG